MWKPTMHKLLRDPLVHFLLLGGLLFAIYFLMNPADQFAAGNQIHVTQGDIERFKQLFQKQWQRSPNQQELQGLIDAYVKEQVFYREALAMGLEKDDTIVRRRLAQKVEFLIGDVTVPGDVDDKELMAFYEQNSARYTRAAKLSFRHIYFNPDKRGERLLDEARATLQTLQSTRAGVTVSDDLGDRFMLPLQYQQISTDDVARDFGREFADKIATLTPGEWHGPIKSGYGVHLVYVAQRDNASIYPFNEVRERVKNDYLFELRQARNEEVLEKLKARYQIVIDGT